jgi:dihydrolipoamide dehydrogenase
MSTGFDLAVVGAGPGGYVACIKAAQLGMKVVCIDSRAALGGTCLNIGCIPSKALLDSSEYFALARTRFAKHGIKMSGLSLDLPAMLARKDQVVKQLTDGISFLFRKNKISAVQGTATLAGPGKLRVRKPDGATESLEAKNFILATGSEPLMLPILKYDGKQIVTSTEALCFDRVPAHLVVVGGGYIGLELGSVWSRLGAKVTVVEFLPRILPLTDSELAGMLHKLLVRENIAFQLDTEVTGAEVNKGQVTVNATGKDGNLKLTADKVLVAVGRRPNSGQLGLKEAGVNLEERTGRILVNDRFETNVAGVFAIGDLIAGPMLAHKAEEEGIAVAEILAGKKAHVDYSVIPSVIYTWPEVASVGLTEDQVKESGKPYSVGRCPFQANGRARALDEAEGLVKVITDKKTDRLLGIHIIGPRASELIAEATLAMAFMGSSEDIARTCHAHPTLAEAIREAAIAAHGPSLQC